MSTPTGTAGDSTTDEPIAQATVAGIAGITADGAVEESGRFASRVRDKLGVGRQNIRPGGAHYRSAVALLASCS